MYSSFLQTNEMSDFRDLKDFFVYFIVLRIYQIYLKNITLYLRNNHAAIYLKNNLFVHLLFDVGIVQHNYFV